METTHLPRSHTRLAETTVGAPYGHVPGHQYHDVDVLISRSAGGTIRVQIVETWGSCQGYDEEHGRRSVVARDVSLEQACREATVRARTAGIREGYLIEAMSQAEDAAAEIIEEKVVQ